MREDKKTTVITFKAEEELLSALEKLPNKSEFIREAIFNALKETCPLCGGAGFLNEKQRRHWKSFAREHTLRRCGRCDGLSIECRDRESSRSHPKKSLDKEKCL
ncbi:MAG: hypothetical protein BWY31_02332 [Lentisphaerae bacterium ADurb.Bin242]|nr:MAG: hypothetical protein BWY31_02332 [Lentisphaerae bacterium ADurb.Bin242]